MTDYRHVLRTAAAWFVFLAFAVSVHGLVIVLLTTHLPAAKTEEAPIAEAVPTPAPDTSTDDSEDHTPWYMTNHVPRPRDEDSRKDPPRDEPPQPPGTTGLAPAEAPEGPEGKDAGQDLLARDPDRPASRQETLDRSRAREDWKDFFGRPLTVQDLVRYYDNLQPVESGTVDLRDLVDRMRGRSSWREPDVLRRMRRRMDRARDDMRRGRP